MGLLPVGVQEYEFRARDDGVEDPMGPHLDLPKLSLDLTGHAWGADAVFRQHREHGLDRRHVVPREAQDLFLDGPVPPWRRLVTNPHGMLYSL